jgi:hypothetical protein
LTTGSRQFVHGCPEGARARGIAQAVILFRVAARDQLVRQLLGLFDERVARRELSAVMEARHRDAFAM